MPLQIKKQLGARIVDVCHHGGQCAKSQIVFSCRTRRRVHRVWHCDKRLMRVGPLTHRLQQRCVACCCLHSGRQPAHVDLMKQACFACFQYLKCLGVVANSFQILDFGDQSRRKSGGVRKFADIFDMGGSKRGAPRRHGESDKRSEHVCRSGRGNGVRQRIEAFSRLPEMPVYLQHVAICLREITVALGAHPCVKPPDRQWRQGTDVPVGLIVLCDLGEFFIDFLYRGEISNP